VILKKKSIFVEISNKIKFKMAKDYTDNIKIKEYTELIIKKKLEIRGLTAKRNKINTELTQITTEIKNLEAEIEHYEKLKKSRNL
jgi:hypothetical protein